MNRPTVSGARMRATSGARMRVIRFFLFCAVLAAWALTAGSAYARVDSVFGGRVACTASGTIRVCNGSSSNLVPTFDGVPLDVTVALPAEPTGGTDGNYPLLIMMHGWGGQKLSVDALRPWAERGYTVLTFTFRGFGESCGARAQARLTQAAACAQGYIRLMDTRYEVRDAQYLAGLLADQETAPGVGLIDPQRIGVTGVSYGGGASMALAALRDRVMRLDGSYMPWRSPQGKPLRIAAAAPEIPWSDLAYSLVPNGRTLDYVADAQYGQPVGVMKQSYVSGLFALGLANGQYAPPGSNPEADIVTWFALLNLGDPYDANPRVPEILEEVRKHHSSYTIDDSEPPAPLLISNGFTDDLFPIDEALRFYNRARTRHPDAWISLFFLDYGHARGQNKPAEVALLRARQREFFDYFLKGEGSEPRAGVDVVPQTCGASSAAPVAIHADSWAQLARGEVRFHDEAPRTLASVGGDPTRAATFDPIAGKGACATVPADDDPTTVNYRLPTVAGDGYTLAGSPTVIAEIESPVPGAQLAARLLDVAPDGSSTLVARALYRPDPSGRQVFQLHGNVWRFAPGHVPKLELLPRDAPYGRPSNPPFTMTISKLELRLPVLERPDCRVILAPAAKLLPPGQTLARDFAALAASPDPCTPPASGGPAGGAGSPPSGGGGGPVGEQPGGPPRGQPPGQTADNPNPGENKRPPNPAPGGRPRAERTARAQAPACVAPRARVNGRSVGRFRLGATLGELVRAIGQPADQRGRLARWCVRGTRSLVTVAFDRRGRVRAVVTSAPGHRYGALAPGAKAPPVLLKRVRSGPFGTRLARLSTRAAIYAVLRRGRVVAIVVGDRGAIAPALSSRR